MAQRIINIACLVVLLGHVLAAFVVAQGGPSQETINASTLFRIDDNARRLTNLEEANLPLRVSVIESSLDEIKYLARGAALAIVGQLTVAALGLYGKRRGGTA